MAPDLRSQSCDQSRRQSLYASRTGLTFAPERIARRAKWMTRMDGMIRRRQPIGAEIVSEGRVHFRVWAQAQRSRGRAGSRPDSVPRAGSSARSRWLLRGTVAGASSGTRYRFRLGGSSARVLPDPASRYQPEGPCGPSEVIDPSCFRWTDQAWRGIVSVEGQVLYELHIGTFTRARNLDRRPSRTALSCRAGRYRPRNHADGGISGSFGWGYDGVNLFAPFHGYGTPDDVRRFVDRAHALGLGVILDVVYNHLGPEGNFLGSTRRLHIEEVSVRVGRYLQLRWSGNGRSANSFWRTSLTGSTNSISTACESMPLRGSRR